MAFPAVEEDSPRPADLEQRNISSPGISQPSNKEPNHIPLPAESKAIDEIHTAINAEAIATPPPGHVQALDDISDSDDYEPPEPTTPVDLAPVTSDAAGLVPESSSLPLHTNVSAEAEAASPDQGPMGNEQPAIDRAELAEYDPGRVSTVLIALVHLQR